jgi:hypothetical protein
VVSVVFYLNKDKIIPNPNADYEELYSTFLQAEGTIVSSESIGGRRSRTIYTIQFSDQANNLITVTEDSWQTMPLKKGDKLLMYYNPQNPQQATPESRWKEVMRKQ